MENNKQKELVANNYVPICIMPDSLVLTSAEAAAKGRNDVKNDSLILRGNKTAGSMNCQSKEFKSKALFTAVW